MKWITGGAIVVSVLMATTASDTVAQDADTVSRRGGRRGGPGIERIMSMRERLELTESQLAALEELRSSSVAMRSAQAAAMADMRSRLEAGQIRRSDLMAFMEDRRDASGDVVAAHQERIESILDEAQLETLQESRVRGRRGARGAQGMRGSAGPQRGFGMHGRVGNQRGFRMQRGAGWQGRMGRSEFRGPRRPGRGGPARMGRGNDGSGVDDFGPIG